MKSFRPHRGGGAYERLRPWRSPHGPSYLDADRPRRGDARSKPDLILVGLIALAILGAWIAGRDRDDTRSGVSSRPAPTRNAALALAPIKGWTATTSVPRLEGMKFEQPVVLEERVSGTRLVAGLLPAESATLLPSALVRRARTPLMSPETTQLGRGTAAFRYTALPVAGARGLVDIYAVPTTAGIATIACVAGPGSVWPHSDCARNAATLTLRRGRALPLGPDAAFRQRLPGAMLALENTRQQARGQLATRVPAQQAAAAAKLSAAYRTGAASLAPLAPASRPRTKALVRELAGAGRAYRAVVGALMAADTAAFRHGQAAVHARERRIDQLLELPTDE